MNVQKKQPGYKPFKLTKTAIASLTLTPRQMQAILGGGGTGTTPGQSNTIANDACSTKPPSHTTL